MKRKFHLVRCMLGLATGLLLVGTPTLAAGDERPSASVDQVRAKIQVKGSVVDVTGGPLPGATVLEPATGNGAITDIDGRSGQDHSHDHHAGEDKFHIIHPDTKWEAGVEHGEKIGLGSREYTLVRV